MVFNRKPRMVFVLLVLILGIIFVSLITFIGSSSNSQQSVESPQKITLVQNVPRTMSEDMTLLLTELSVPSKECVDCKAIVRIQVTKNGTPKILEYRAGGIQGELKLTESAFGFDFTVTDLKENEVTLAISPSK